MLHADWNWDAGKDVDVWVYSNADAVELFVNGASLGVKTMPTYGHVEWDAIPYVPGSLRAVAYANGSSTPIAQQWRNTTGAPAALRISIKDGFGATLIAGCRDAAIVAVAVVDEAGLEVPTASNEVTFSITGPATIEGTSNGDPACLTNNKSPTRAVFHSLVVAVIAGGDVPGAVSVSASSPGLPTVSVPISIIAPPAGWTAAWCSVAPRL